MGMSTIDYSARVYRALFTYKEMFGNGPTIKDLALLADIPAQEIMNILLDKKHQNKVQIADGYRIVPCVAVSAPYYTRTNTVNLGLTVRTANNAQLQELIPLLQGTQVYNDTIFRLPYSYQNIDILEEHNVLSEMETGLYQWGQEPIQVPIPQVPAPAAADVANPFAIPDMQQRRRPELNFLDRSLNDRYAGSTATGNAMLATQYDSTTSDNGSASAARHQEVSPGEARFETPRPAYLNPRPAFEEDYTIRSEGESANRISNEFTGGYDDSSRQFNQVKVKKNRWDRQ